MKSTVLKYGTISGLIMAILLFTTIPFASKMGFTAADMLLFFGKIIAFIPIFFGIRFFRQTIGERYITFWKAFNVGILIVVVCCVFYSISWNILYYWVSPDFPDKYFQFYIEQMKLHGALPKDITDAQTQFAESKKVLVNPLINGAYAFTDPITTGILSSLLCAALLRKTSPISNLPVELKDANQN